jgi:hypothetical protein
METPAITIAAVMGEWRVAVGDGSAARPVARAN